MYYGGGEGSRLCGLTIGLCVICVYYSVSSLKYLVCTQRFPLPPIHAFSLCSPISAINIHFHVVVFFIVLKTMFSCYIKSAVSTHNIQAKQFLRYSSEIVALKLKKPSTSLHKRSKLVDKVRLYIKGGSGGQGCLSAGGVGGKGGSVYIKCVKGASLGQYTLLRNRRVVAGHGSNYKKGRLKVISGQDAYVLVPPGTEVRSGNNVLITDLNKEEQIIKVANGGAAGSAKTTDFNGLRGESKNIVLELKTIADVALTGFPNAGKSSLLCALSRARPKVGNYPFTTIRPMVGSIFYSDSRQVCCTTQLYIDIPL